ncbi:MAG: hypothetical protein NVS1B12_16710 [Acidimicrobiales bacterium]
MRVDEALNQWEQADLDRFELELRKLAAVVAVGFEGSSRDRPVSPDEVLTVHVLVSDPALRDEVEQQAIDLGRLHYARPLQIAVTIEGEEPGDGVSTAAHASAATAPSRVRVDAIEVTGPPAAVEVTLAHGESRGTGRGQMGAPAGAAAATLAALRQLGWAVPFDVKSAVRLALGTSGAVLVHLMGKDGERLGVSSGASVEEAAVKATLQALNRWLDDPNRRPMTLRPANDSF